MSMLVYIEVLTFSSPTMTAIVAMGACITGVHQPETIPTSPGNIEVLVDGLGFHSSTSSSIATPTVHSIYAPAYIIQHQPYAATTMTDYHPLISLLKLSNAWWESLLSTLPSLINQTLSIGAMQWWQAHYHWQQQWQRWQQWQWQWQRWWWQWQTLSQLLFY